MLAIAGEKFCDKCRRIVLDRMKSDGYLQDNHERKAVSEQYGRPLTSSGTTIGGSAEFGHDGDDE